MLISVLFFLFISLSIVSGLVSPAVAEVKTSSDLVKSRQSYFLSESAVEDAYYRLKNGKTLGSTDTITLNGSSATATITNSGSNEKTISSLGDVSSRQRKNQIVLNTGFGASFNYGVQVGQGGIDLQGSSGVNGNVYANGPITGTSSSFISGTAIADGGLIQGQANGTGTPAMSLDFGNTAATEDIGEGFKVTKNGLSMNKIQFYIKKIGNPGDATVTVACYQAGCSGTFLTGTLSAAAVSSSYSWVDVPIPPSYTALSSSTYYWVFIDNSSNSSSDYYNIALNNGVYADGAIQIGQIGNANWKNYSNYTAAVYFNIFENGLGSIAGSSGSQYNQLKVGTGSVGSAQAHTVNYVQAAGLIFCQNGTGNNKLCVPQADPPYINYPISDATIAGWKNDAAAGGIYSGTYNTPNYGTSSLGPEEITGDLNVTGSNTLYITGTLWVKGNITVSGSAKIVLDPSYGSSSGIIVADGWLDLEGSGQLNGDGQTGSYILFVTTSNCTSSTCSHNAIDISGAAGSVVLNAQNGTISFSGSASAKEATAYKMKLSGATTVNYETGLTNVNFVSGPSGGWNIKSWKEVK